MLHRSFLVWPNNSPGSTTYLNTNSARFQVAILDRPHTPGDHRTSIKYQLCPNLRVSLRILCQEDRDGFELLRLIGHQEATDHLVISGTTLVLKAKASVLPAHTKASLVEGPEGVARLECRTMSGQDSGKTIM